MKIFSYISFALFALLVGCSTSKVSLNYNPANGAYPVRPGPRQFQVSPFKDERPAAREYSIGAVRTPVGVPLEYLETKLPVSVAVTNGFAYGLEARGMLTAGGARYVVTGEILELGADQVVRPSASARIRFVVLDQRDGGRQVFSNVYREELIDPPFAGGKNTRLKLADLTSQALQKIIDSALDDPNFRAKLR